MSRYFEFLCNIVTDDDNDLPLLEYLHNREFHSTIKNDANRKVDGEKLREAFLDEVGHMASSSVPRKRYCEEAKSEIASLGACSVLEMLIGLAHRMEFQLSGREDSVSVGDIFWMFIENLGIPDNIARTDYLDDIINNFLDRTYNFNGVGGIFPLQETRNDQRKVEIWYQMMEYLCENWEF